MSNSAAAFFLEILEQTRRRYASGREI